MVQDIDVEAISTISALKTRLHDVITDFTVLMGEYDFDNHRKHYNDIWKLRANIELCVAILDYGEKSQFITHTSGALWQQVFLNSLTTPRSSKKIFDLIDLSKTMVMESVEELDKENWQQAYVLLWKARETLGRALGASQPQVKKTK